MASQRIEETWEEECLRNPILLQQIFTHLPTQFLLYSCSLVNKTWNTEARLHVRDKRKCFVRGMCKKSPCQRLQELSQLQERMSENGRVVPWNALQVFFRAKDKCRDEIQLENPSRLLALKHLELGQLAVGLRGTACLAHRPFQALLSQGSGRLLSLTLWGIDIHFAQALASPRQPNFPLLKEITIRLVYFRKDELSPINESLRRIMNGAPKLEKILVSGQKGLYWIPAERYHLLRSLTLDHMSGQDGALFEKIVKARPQLEELEIYRTRAESNYADDPPDRDDVSQESKFDNVLQKMLQTCHQSMKVFHINGVYPLHQLTFSPLTNLSKLTMYATRECSSEFDHFWGFIVRIDFGRSMPNLHEMEIAIVTGDGARHEHSEESWCTKEWPPHGFHAISPCDSLRKLTLALSVARINMAGLKSVFSDVTSLELRMNDNRGTQADPAPFSQIAEAWPDLQRLTITGRENVTLRNHDSDVVGISEDELEVLRGMDSDHWQAVRLVPIKPSLATMSSLRDLMVDLTFYPSVGDSASLVSEMAQFLTFDRTPHLRASIFCTYHQCSSRTDREVCLGPPLNPSTQMALRLTRIWSSLLCCTRPPREQ